MAGGGRGVPGAPPPRVVARSGDGALDDGMSWIVVYNTLQWVVRIVMIAVVLRRRRDPPASLAWLMIIFFEPFIGAAVYLLIGDRRLGRRRRRLYRKVVVTTRTPTRLDAQLRHVVRPELDRDAADVVAQSETYGGMPILGGNNVELVVDTEQMVERLVADIRRARHHVHMLFYIIMDDQTSRQVFDAMADAVSRGVACRVLADHAGSWRFFRRGGMADEMRSKGIQIHPCLPVNPLSRRLVRIDLRNHRKVVVIDNRIGYAGSQNLVNPDYGHRRAGPWHDLMGRFRGPVVSQLQTVFLEDWMFETGELIDDGLLQEPLESRGNMPAQVVATGPTDRDVTFEVIPRVLLAAINSARWRIILTTPYLIPDETTLLALSLAVDRGVQVDVVVPRRVDQLLVGAAARYYYDRLIDIGVNLYLHHEGLLHAKTITVDDSLALLGSTNLDRRSFYLNFELNVLMFGPQITRQLRFAQTGYISESDPIDVTAWRHRPVLTRYGQATAALFSPLL